MTAINAAVNRTINNQNKGGFKGRNNLKTKVIPEF